MFSTRTFSPEPPLAPPAVVADDPDDNPVIATAVAGEAEILCTLDRHIRRSRKVKTYCADHGIRILTDVELLRLLR